MDIPDSPRCLPAGLWSVGPGQRCSGEFEGSEQAAAPHNIGKLLWAESRSCGLRRCRRHSPVSLSSGVFQAAVNAAVTTQAVTACLRDRVEK